MAISHLPALGRLLSPVLLLGVLSGCQAVPNAPTEQQVSEQPEKRVYLRLYDDNQVSGEGITLVAKDERLQKAIRHAFPDTPLKADSGIDMNFRLDVWAENLSPTAFLEHLGSQAGVIITQNGRGEIELRSTDQWAFSLPVEDADALMPQAKSIASTHGVQTISLGDSQHVLLLTGPVESLAKTRRALEQLSDRVRLERTLQPVSVM
jgi:hypothetical protein